MCYPRQVRPWFSVRSGTALVLGFAAIHGCRFGFDVSDTARVIPLGGGAGETSLGGQMNVGGIGGEGGAPAVCGDGVLAGAETCDTGTASPAGCNSCREEPGWNCPLEGGSCVAICGDGIVLGAENCDDAEAVPQDGDGCSNSCRIEPGHGCTGQPSACTMRDCGNGVIDGDESCDEGIRNGVYYGDGSGCTTFCTREPDCRAGGVDGCVSDCGDGMRVDPEECDDGNTAENDGCSSSCVIEPGFTCMTETFTDTLPCSHDKAKECLQLPVIYRDFIAAGFPGGHDDMLINGNMRSTGETIGIGPGLCQDMLADTLDAQGKPLLKVDYMGCEELGGALSIASMESFSDWYDPTHPETMTHLRSFELERIDSTGAYQFSSSSLFPLDGLTRNDELQYCEEETYQEREPLGVEPCTQNHNYHFTSEVRYVFRYQGGEVLDFRGDDDVYVFVNGRKALDLGGAHPPESGTVNLDEQGLTLGKIYEIVVFHAERMPVGSNYQLTLAGFEVERTTSCTLL